MIKYLRRACDGMTIEIPTEYYPEDGFYWIDGNFGCDCNREMVFEAVTDNICDCHSGQCSDDRFVILDENKNER